MTVVEGSSASEGCAVDPDAGMGLRIEPESLGVPQTISDRYRGSGRANT